jgi:phosphate transport system protein
MTEGHAPVVGFVHLLFCAKNIERVGDHATNIAEAAYLATTGVLPADERVAHAGSSTTSTDIRPHDHS